MIVEITSRKLVTPSSPTPPHLQSLKISIFDQVAPHHYVPTIFYYPDHKDEGYRVNNSEKSLLLQKGLSDILTLYYPLAGRCARDELLVECNDKGAEYLEAQVNCSLSQLLLETECQIHLAPERLDPNYNSPLVVQFNTFECGGIAIGVSMIHKLADGFTAFTFIDAWAAACRIGVGKVSCPSFELASIFPPRDAYRKNNLVLLKIITTNKIVTRRFLFDGVAISNLKAVTSSGVIGSELLKLQLTRVKVVTALIWRTLIRLAQARHGRMRPSILRVPMNLRGMFKKIPIADNCFGNFRSWAVPQFMPNDDENCEVHLHDLVCRIREGIESSVSKYSKASSADELASMVIEDISKISEGLKESEVDVYMFTSWCRFPLYEADFGWGKPTLACRGAQAQHEMILLLDIKDGNGIEAWVSLEEQNMLPFQQDADVMAFGKIIATNTE